MTTRVLAALAATATLLGGCNETITRTTNAGKPVLAYAMAMYTDGSCWSWEPPEVSVATPPANGRVAHALVKAPLQMPGSKCDGQVVDARVSLYKPNPGFRGQDRLTLLYDGIRNDGGGRFVTSKDVVIDVK